MSTEAEKEFNKVIDWIDSNKDKIKTPELFQLHKLREFYNLIGVTSIFKKGLYERVISNLIDENSIDDIIDDIKKFMSESKNVVYTYHLQVEKDSCNFSNIPLDEDVKIITDELYSNRGNELKAPLLLYKNDNNEISRNPTSELIGYVLKFHHHSDSNIYEGIIENDLVVLNKELNGL